MGSHFWVRLDLFLADFPFEVVASSDGASRISKLSVIDSGLSLAGSPTTSEADRWNILPTVLR